MDKQYLQNEFDSFFEFPTDDKSQVSSVSARLFVEHMAQPIEAQVEQQQAKLNALREAIAPFVLLMKGTRGRIPTERLSFADWHELSKAWKLLTADVGVEPAAQRPARTAGLGGG